MHLPGEGLILRTINDGPGAVYASLHERGMRDRAQDRKARGGEEGRKEEEEKGRASNKPDNKVAAAAASVVASAIDDGGQLLARYAAVAVVGLKLK